MIFVFLAFITFFLVLFWSAEKVKATENDHLVKGKQNLGNSPKSSNL